MKAKFWYTFPGKGKESCSIKQYFMGLAPSCSACRILYRCGEVLSREFSTKYSSVCSCPVLDFVGKR